MLQCIMNHYPSITAMIKMEILSIVCKLITITSASLIAFTANDQTLLRTFKMIKMVSILLFVMTRFDSNFNSLMLVQQRTPTLLAWL